MPARTAEASERSTVCLYSIATHLGGGERSLLDLASGLRDSNEVHPWVLLPKQDGPLSDELASRQVDRTVLSMPPALLGMSRGAPARSVLDAGLAAPSTAIYLSRLVLELRRRKARLIHSNSLKCHVLAVLAGGAARIPVIWHLRDIFPRGNTLRVLTGLAQLPHVHLIANSRATAEGFAPAHPRMHVIHNGLNPEKFAPNPNRKFNRLFGVDDTVPIIGIVGIIARWKGQAEFLKLAAELIRRGSPARFVVIGGEIYDTGSDLGFSKELKRLASDLGIADRVHFTGFESQTAGAINGLDVLVHASVKPEPFGRVIIEGMACEVPVIAAAAGGVTEIIVDGKSGMLARSGDIESYANRIELLLAEPELRRRIAAAGRERFLSHFTASRHVNAVRGLYRSLLAPKR